MMPEGYRLIEDFDRLYVAKDEGAMQCYLRNSAGHQKIFRSEAKAEAYAHEHKRLNLAYDQVVPGKPKRTRLQAQKAGD